MSYSKGKKQTKKKSSDISVTSKIRTGWLQKRPILVFALGFFLFLILFYIVWQSEYFNNNIHPIIISINAALSSGILKFLGQNTTANNEIISSPIYSISIARGCDAIEAMALFLSTTLAFPMKWKKKLIGILSGLGILFVLNLIRIVTLFLAGKYKPDIFETLHVQIWPVIIILFATLLWIVIIRTEKRKTVSDAK